MGGARRVEWHVETAVVAAERPAALARTVARSIGQLVDLRMSANTNEASRREVVSGPQGRDAMTSVELTVIGHHLSLTRRADGTPHRTNASPAPASEYRAMTSCEECGFVYDDVPVDRIGSSLRERAAGFVDALGAVDDVHARPAADVWSPLEYACHVRDVLRIQLGRVARALVEDTPSFEPMQRDERPARYRYDAQLPEVVALEVSNAAGALADVFDALDDGHLARTVTYNWPERTVRPLRWVGRHTVHELVHHRMDLQRGR
jgi:S-DNA-T family DNA segregation ATPase FtsK/SpoIIIE